MAKPVYAFSDPVPAAYLTKLTRVYWINGSRITTVRASNPGPWWPVETDSNNWTAADWEGVHEYLASLALARGDEVVYVDAELVPWTTGNYAKLISSVNGVRSGYPNAKIVIYYCLLYTSPSPRD